MIAFAKGCSERASKEAAIDRSSSRLTAAGRMSVTSGFPLVSVPVLSSTTVSTLCKCSKASAFLKSTPIRAALPVPTIIATGVAKPRAQGQEITRTAILVVMENSKSFPASIHTIKAATAIVITTGTNIPAILSASLAMGALEPPACSTNRIT